MKTKNNYKHFSPLQMSQWFSDLDETAKYIDFDKLKETEHSASKSIVTIRQCYVFLNRYAYACRASAC